MLQVLEAKIKDLAEKLESSAANHNALLGAMGVLRELYNDAIKVSDDLKQAEVVVSELEAVV